MTALSAEGARASAAAPGLRQRKKAEARAALVEAALRLFAERGFDAVTVEEIAEAAGVSRRTFFRYFPAKEEVALERRRVQLDILERTLAAAPPSVPVEVVIRDALGAVAQVYERDRRRILRERAVFARSGTLALADLELDRAFERAIASAVDERVGGGEGDARRARIFAAALMGVVRVALEDWAASRGRVSLRELGEEAVSAALGMLPARGRPPP